MVTIGVFILAPIGLVAIALIVLAWKGWLPSLVTTDGRKAWALLALLGGCVVFTSFVAAGVYLTRDDPEFSFYLAIAAHVQILIGMLSLGGLLVRRSVKITKDGMEYMDHEVTITPKSE